MTSSSTSIASSTVTKTTPLTLLHTSDWHLGRRLYGRMRYEEFEAFLQWLEDTIRTQQVDVLIVAGDIFDTMTPSNKAQALYYEFLGKVSKSCCQHVVIVAGNHDSPTFLDAPSQVLKFLNVHVIGTACAEVSDELLVLDNNDNEPCCIVAAVPYLRDRDVRGSSAGESMNTKDAQVIAGICAHYDAVADVAKAKQAELASIYERHIPIIATGHLFAAGGKTTADDGVRDLYVGSLGKISADIFDEYFDYVALGHLHVPQRVGGRERIRYSGSPIAMGFGEAKQQKQVLLVQFGAAPTHVDETNVVSSLSNTASDVKNTDISVKSTDVAVPTTPNTDKPTTQKATDSHAIYMDDLFGFDEPSEDEGVDKTIVTSNAPAQQNQSTQPISAKDPAADQTLHGDESNQMQITSLPIPTFQQLAQVSGDLTTISQMIKSLTHNRSIWLEVIYTGDDIVSDLREQVQAMVEGLPCEVLKIKNTRTYNKVLNQEAASETLQDLNEMQVFERCLTVNDITDAQKLTLRDAYAQIIHDIHHKDTQAE